MSEDRDFVRAIRANPDDDLHRLVYADWLEEHDNVRGAFLRLEVRLRRDPDAPDAAEWAERFRELRPLADIAWLAAVSKHGPCFAALRDGDRVTLKFSSHGCFHRYGRDFDFRGPKPIRATVERSLDLEGPGLLGSGALTEPEVADLDRLLADRRTRGEQRSWSTTMTSLQLAWARAGVTVYEESFLDSSGLDNGSVIVRSLADRLTGA